MTLMTLKYMLVAGVAAVLASGPVSARDLRVVERLPGYTCMALNLSYEAQANLDTLPPVLAEPRAGAARLGTASSSVIAVSPLRESNGYLQVLLPSGRDGREGWVRADKLRPWVNENSPRTRCFPARMSDGTLGFDYSRSH